MIEIPFKSEFENRMLSGRKTATTRIKRCGKSGDRFIAFDAEFELTRVSRVYLQDVVSTSYIQEGFNGQLDFIECWKKLHPRKGYDPEQLVWYHEFKLVGKDE